MRRLLAVIVCALIGVVPAVAQTATTRTDKLIATTQAIVGGSTLGANTLNVTGTLGVSSNATVSGTLGVTGTLTATGVVNAGDGSAGAPSIASRLRTSTGLYWTDDGVGASMNVATNGAHALTVYRTGYLGLGDTTPAARLSVNGDVYPTTGYSGNIGTLTKKWLTLHAAELWVETLVAQNTIATIGGRILVLPTTMLSADLGSAVGDTTITVKHNNLANGDRVYLEANGSVEFMAVTSGAGGTAGAYTYSVTRDLDGSGRNAWTAGDAIANTGTTGDGWMDLYSVSGMRPGGSEYGPTIVGNERLSATYNDWEPRWAIGNLNGLYGYSADTYGAAFGDDDASNLTIDATNGIRFRNGSAVLGSWVGSTVTLGQPLTANNTGQIIIDSDSIDFKWRNNAGTSATFMDVYNNGGVAELRVAGTVNATQVLSPLLWYGSGDLTVYSSNTGSNVILRTVAGSVRPYSNDTIPLGTSSYNWSSVYATRYYSGSTAGVVSGTCSSVTVTGGIVTGCTP